MTKIGILNELKVVKIVSFGVYLDGGELGEILLPNRYVPKPCKVDDALEVFIYTDSEDRIIATTETPYAMVGDFALLKVVSVNSVGAFLGWGLPKDLLVPFSEQNTTMKDGGSYLVRIFLDESTHRIAASSLLDNYLNREPAVFQPAQEVGLLIAGKTDIGYKAIIDGSHWGVIHHNEVFQKLRMGQKIKGFIKKVRDDGKIDLCLHLPGYEKVIDLTETILNVLKEQGGFIPITDKSPTDIIYNWFNVSKKTYKKAIGSIYKRRLITIEDTGIRLNPTSS
jgi:predicted RNA-binding protein (virulence factor B family)